MLRWNVLICALFVLSILEVQPIAGRKSFGGGHHSYPKSGGLSGGGHSYPKSGGLSGGGHGGLSGTGRGPVSYPHPPSGGLSGDGHGYPGGGGLSGTGRAPGSNTYPSKPHPSTSNNHGYPNSGGGLSGNNNRQPSGNTHVTHTTNIYHHYNYNPPQQIRYTPVGGGAPMSYPVYRGQAPSYVYHYKNSDSKYGTLLAGLALLNLGTLGAVAYTASHNGHSSSSTYKAQPGEICKFAVKKDNGDYDETKIDCQLISSFIYQEQAKPHSAQSPSNTSITTTTVTNVTVVNNTVGVPQSAPETPVVPGNIVYAMLPNGTLVPLNGTNSTASAPAQPSPNNTNTSSMTVTTITTNTTVVDALEVKGKPIEVTPGMQCFVIRLSPMGNMRKTVPCGLLQSYADQSLRKKNSAARNAPVLTILTVVFTACLVY